jgi:LemA protein
MQQEVEKGWAEIENQLKRRFDLIPNLVETVKGYARHESELFGQIADARKSYFQAQESGNQEGMMKATGVINSGLSRLLLLQERYPDLKANQNFLELQASLEGTENRIAVARTRYNEAVRTLNSYVKSFFGRFLAGLAGVSEARYFDIPEEERQAPKVQFD